MALDLRLWKRRGRIRQDICFQEARDSNFESYIAATDKEFETEMNEIILNLTKKKRRQCALNNKEQ
jgi:hypothetical protein